MRAGSSSREVMTFRVRPAGLPCVAQGRAWRISSSVSRGWGEGKTTFSIICPMTPSARMMEGLRYLKAKSNPNFTKSAISCTEAGASVISL